MKEELKKVFEEYEMGFITLQEYGSRIAEIVIRYSHNNKLSSMTRLSTVLKIFGLQYVLDGSEVMHFKLINDNNLLQ